MAEIKIEKKKSMWPWIIGIIILALLIYFLAFNKRNDTTTKSTTSEDVTSVNIDYGTTVLFLPTA
ncbi:MAG: hypothetical protein ACM3P1_12205 [Candidatus Saccharibacteria bacterium]